jgi:hypothetical protein
MSARRFRTLLRGLPPTARVWHDERGGWSTTDHLLALNAELTHAVYRQLVASTPTKYPKRIPALLHIPRPGEETAKPNVMRPRDLFRRMARR